MMEERDRAIQERNQVFNEMQRTQAESQMKENRIANLNEIVNSKEVLIERLSGEASQVSQKLETMQTDKMKYIEKVETILREQKELRQKD